MWTVNAIEWWTVNGEALTNAQTVHFRFSIHNDDVCVCVWHMRERAPKFYSQLNSSVKRDSLCGVQFLSEYCYYLVKLVCFHICFTLRLSSAQNAKECRIKCLERIRDFLSNCWKWKRQKKKRRRNNTHTSMKTEACIQRSTEKQVQTAVWTYL